MIICQRICFALAVILFFCGVQGFVYSRPKNLRLVSRNRFSSSRTELRMSSDVIHFWNMQLGGSVAHLDSDVLLEMMLLESALLKTTSELYIRDKLELIWFNQFVRKFNDQASETGNSKTFNSLVKALIDTNAGQLSLYREVDDNPSQSCTVRVNINPHKIATLMMEQKDEVFQDIVQLMSLIARENDECYKFAALNRDEGEEIAKRNRASVFSSIDVKWPGPLLKANFEVLNLFVTNFALDRCKKRKGEELATYLKDFVENISYSKTLSDLLTIRNRQKEDGRSSKAGTGRSSSSSSSSSGGGGGGDFDDSVASQATSPSSSTSSVLTTALPFSLRLTVGVGSSTAPAAYPTGRNARYMDRDSYAPGSPRHLLERLLVLRQQVDDEERDQLRMEGNRIITSDNSEFPSIHSRVGNNQRLFFTPNINIKDANAVPPAAPTPTNEKEEEEKDYDKVEAEYNEEVVATRPGEYTVFAINDGKTQATEEDEDDNAYISDFDDWMEGQLEKQQARTASAGGGETETEAERRRRIYSNPSSSSSSSSSGGALGSSSSSSSSSSSTAAAAGSGGGGQAEHVDAVLKRARFLGQLRTLGDELAEERTKVTSQLNLTLMMMNGTYQQEKFDFHRRSKRNRGPAFLEKIEDDVSEYSRASRATRALYIKSQGFKLDEKSNTVYYLIEDPTTDSDDENGNEGDIPDDGDTATSTFTPSTDGSLSQQDLSGLEDIGGSLEEDGRKGWRAEDGSREKPGEESVRQKLSVSLLDPPRDKPPKIPTDGEDGSDDDPNRREEDESDRKPVDFGDIEYCDISEFYELDVSASVRIIGMTEDDEDGSQYVCLEAKLLSNPGNVVRRWVNYDDAINFLQYGRAPNQSESGISEANISDDGDSSNSSSLDAKKPSIATESMAPIEEAGENESTDNTERNDDDEDPFSSPFFGGKISMM